jgi:hypothetical protein
MDELTISGQAAAAEGLTVPRLTANVSLDAAVLRRRQRARLGRSTFRACAARKTITAGGQPGVSTGRARRLRAYASHGPVKRGAFARRGGWVEGARMTRLAMTASLAVSVFCLALGCEAAKAQAPGPLLSYPSAAPAGRTLFNVADRLAILNLVSAYSLAFDTCDAEAFFKLFADDAVVATGTPGAPPVVLSGAEFRKTWGDRIEALKKTGARRRHLMSNVVFLEETPRKAHISVVGLLANTQDGATFKPVAILNYEGWLVNQNGEWKIQRWNDFPDSGGE